MQDLKLQYFRNKKVQTNKSALRCQAKQVIRGNILNTQDDTVNIG